VCLTARQLITITPFGTAPAEGSLTGQNASVLGYLTGGGPQGSTT
jgi:hypothetical protein